MSRAPAKIILCGEHAVVYGQAAIAVPFNALSATVEAEPIPSGGVYIEAHDTGETFHLSAQEMATTAPDNGLLYAVALTLRALSCPVPDLILHVRSDIPVGGGLGSGAAVTTAMIRELSRVLGNPLEGEALNTLVYEVERFYHGTPSGIDNTVIVFERPIYFVRRQPPQSITVGAPLTLLVADSGIPGSTRETVAHVREQHNANPGRVDPILDQIGQLVSDARAALGLGDWPRLGVALNENHTLLRELGVSLPLLDTLVQAARQSGAYGAKLSGGGGGGNVIAAVPPDTAETIMGALKTAGAVRVWRTTLNKG